MTPGGNSRVNEGEGELAAVWLAAGPAEAAALHASIPSRADAERLAWALRATATAQWSRDPGCIPRAAERAAELSAAHGGDVLAALAQWLGGLEALMLQRFVQARERLQAASDRLREIGRPLEAVQARVSLPAALSMLGEHDAAAEEALSLTQQLDSLGDAVGASRALLNLGSLRMRQDRYGEAAAAYRSAGVRFARLGDAPHSVMAEIGLALALSWQTELAEAGRILARARARAARQGLTSLVALAEINAGRLELLSGQPATALRRLESAARHAEQAGTAALKLEVQRHLADAYLAVNLLPEAQALLQRALDTATAAVAPLDAAWIALRLVETHLRRGAVADAGDSLSRAAARIDGQPLPVARAWCDLMAARIATHHGEHAPAARLARSAATAFEAAQVRLLAQEAEAAALVSEAALHADAGAPPALGALEALHVAAGSDDLRARIAVEVAALQMQHGRGAEAGRWVHSALDSLEAMQARLPADEFRVAYGEQAARADDLHLTWLELHCASPEALLEAQDRGRARALALALAAARTPGRAADMAPHDATTPGSESGASLGADAAIEEEARNVHLRWLHTQWQLALAGLTPGDAVSLHRQLLQAEAAAAQSRRDAATRSAPDGGDAPAGRAWVLQEDLLAELGDDAAIVSYRFVGERLLVCLLRRGAAQALWLPAAGLARRIESLRFQLDAARIARQRPAGHAAPLLERTRAHLQALHRAVWQPLVAWLGEAREVIVLPHGPLHGVPFAALHDGERWLIERHTLVMAPSLAAWLATRRRWRARSGPPGPLLAVGVGGVQLPAVAAEVAAVASAFCGQATMLTEAEATLPAIKKALPGVDLLHLACHGNFRADNPGFSALHLADGSFSLHEVQTLPLSARLVTLSACESALSRVSPGEDRVGLVRAFLVGGCAAVVASAWAVDDASTALLMGRFYQHLGSGSGPAHALQQAQMEWLAARADDAVLAHPFHWAAFAVHGCNG